MKILIARQSQLLIARTRHQVNAVVPGAEIGEALTLTDAYHFAEHHEPVCAIIGDALASLPEFELLVSLFAVMKITCFVITNDASKPKPHPVHDTVRILPEGALSGAIAQAAFGTIGALRTQQETSDKVTAVHFDPRRLILLGASTGGIDALLTVTRNFDDQSPPVLIVQHTGGTFSKSLIRLLDSACAASVLAARDEMAVKPGHIYLAPDDQSHLALAQTRRPEINLKGTAAVSGHRPSVDALFQSALHCAPYVSAALLTGMGKDGAVGLTRLRQAGAFTIGQDRQTSVVYGMPRIAMEMGGVCRQLPIDQIGPALLASCQARQGA